MEREIWKYFDDLGACGYNAVRDLGALGVSDEVSARQRRPSVAIKTADLYKHEPQLL